MSGLKLSFSEQADRDIEEIWVYLAGYDVGAADIQITTMVEKCAYLTEMPHMGARRDELRPGLRRIIEGNYSIFYVICDDTIEIVRVLRSNRDLPQYF